MSRLTATLRNLAVWGLSVPFLAVGLLITSCEESCVVAEGDLHTTCACTVDDTEEEEEDDAREDASWLGSSGDDDALECLYTEEQFVEDYYRVTCERTFACYDAATLELFGYGDDAEECFGFFWDAYSAASQGNASCGFEASAAFECVEALSDLDCDGYKTGAFPPACSEVCG